EKLVWVENIPSPYNLDLFEQLQKTFAAYECHFVYTNASEDNREWSLGNHQIDHIHVLKSRILKLKGRSDTHYIHLPGGDLKRLLNELDPVCVFAWEYNPAALQCLSWCRKHGRKLVHVTEGTLHSERYIGKLQKISRRRIIKGADACIGCSTKSVEKLKWWGADEDRVFLSLLTRNLTDYTEKETESIPGRILYVGRLISLKGLDLLINALKYVQSDYTLHLVGSGEEETALKVLAEENHVGDRITWCGYLEGQALTKEYREAALFVFPSLEDCYGLVLVEALASGVPIVSSKYADGAYDTVRNGINGRIIDPYDAESFAAAIDECLKDEYKERAEQTDVSPFLLEHTVQGFVDAFETAMK
ncbi:MAG: glycosyltransferase, partial [Solobacterium sp.]|nr:glycosyltransferase [Solobacterium sp.]